MENLNTEEVTKVDFTLTPTQLGAIAGVLMTCVVCAVALLLKSPAVMVCEVVVAMIVGLIMSKNEGVGEYGEWEKLMKEHLDWCARTFPKGTAYGAALHAEREIKEVQVSLMLEEPTERLSEEYADCFGALIDSARREGISPDMLLGSWRKKLEKNKARTWKYNGDGSYSHIKEVSNGTESGIYHDH